MPDLDAPYDGAELAMNTVQKSGQERAEDPFHAAEFITAYEHGIEELRTAVAGMTSEQLRARPIGGKWSTIEVVCHIADSEQFFADRMECVMAMHRPLLPVADENTYPGPLVYQERDLAEELDLVAVTRRQMTRILKHAPADAWERAGVHTEVGLVTLRQLLLKSVQHLQHHLKFIAENARPWRQGNKCEDRRRCGRCKSVVLACALGLPSPTPIKSECNCPRITSARAGSRRIRCRLPCHRPFARPCLPCRRSCHRAR